ncbi:MAG: hypothetical protein ACE5IR_09025 [bacterium]
MQRIVDKALDKHIETRYQHVADLAADLKSEKQVYLKAEQSTKLQPEISSSESTIKIALEKGRPKSSIGYKSLLAISTAILLIIILGLLVSSGLIFDRASPRLNRGGEISKPTENVMPEPSPIISELIRITNTKTLSFFQDFA